MLIRRNSLKQKSWDDYIKYALGKIPECDTIVMLPGWIRSRGAKRELCEAESALYERGKSQQNQGFKNHQTRRKRMSDIVKNNQLPISSLADITALGKMIAASGMFGIKNDDAGAIAAATCFQQNITLLDFARTYHIIEGRPTMKADAMAAEFRKRGGKYKVIERSVSLAKAEFEFEGQCCNFEFSIKQAQDAGFCYSGDKKTLRPKLAQLSRKYAMGKNDVKRRKGACSLKFALDFTRQRRSWTLTSQKTTTNVRLK